MLLAWAVTQPGKPRAGVPRGHLDTQKSAQPLALSFFSGVIASCHQQPSDDGGPGSPSNMHLETITGFKS